MIQLCSPASEQRFRRAVRRGRRRFKLSTKSTRWPASARRWAMCCLLVHSGEFHASEFVHDMMMSSSHDPTFDQAHRELWQVTQAGIVS